MSEEWKAQYNKAGRLWFWGVDVQENPEGHPESRSHLCVCQASLLMTFAMGGIPHAFSRQGMGCWKEEPSNRYHHALISCPQEAWSLLNRQKLTVSKPGAPLHLCIWKPSLGQPGSCCIRKVWALVYMNIVSRNLGGLTSHWISGLHMCMIS